MTKSLLHTALISLFLMLVPVSAQADPTSDEWQAAITGQVDAFHAGDASGALSFATAGFKTSFADPEAFVAAVRNSGYGAIVESRSHSFGAYQLVEPDVVLQAVTFIGPDQIVYEAIYQLQREDGAWHIGSVQLMKTGGRGV